MEQAPRSRARVGLVLAALFAIAGFTACSPRDQDSPKRSQEAKALFDAITRDVHVPSAAVNGAERMRLENEAASRYAALVKRFPEQSNLCAQALRSIGNIHAARTNVDAAVKQFTTVAERYPTQEWETLQALKAAADLLWEHGRRPEAQRFYSDIVSRFDRPDAPAIIQSVVRGSKAKLPSSGTANSPH